MKYEGETDLQSYKILHPVYRTNKMRLPYEVSGRSLTPSAAFDTIGVHVLAVGL